MDMVRRFCSLLGLCALIGCASTVDRQRYALREQAPRDFVGDGCTLAPDLNFRHCCDAHDRAYWQGGSCSERRRADGALRACMRAAGRPILGAIYGSGVRVGGYEWWPTPWRWGFGWPYGLSCRLAEQEQEHAMQPASVQIAEQILEAALLLDRKSGNFNAEIDQALQQLLQVGALAPEPALIADYSNFYLPRLPLRISGAPLVMVEYQNLDQWLGCCVNPGFSLFLHGESDDVELHAFAKARNCSLRSGPEIYLPAEAEALVAASASSTVIELSCAEQDAYE